MAKIVLKNYEELLLPDEVAVEIRERIATTRKEIEGKGLSLNMFPLVLETVSGLWSGSMADIAQISDSSKLSKRIGYFTGIDRIKEFHVRHGYGGNQAEYLPGYGSLDVKTKYLIRIKKAKIVDNFSCKNLVMIEWKDKEKSKYWSDLWDVYEVNLDEFNELLPDDKLTCRI